MSSLGRVPLRQLACVYRVEPIESHGTHLAKMASIHNDSDLGRRDGLHRIPEKLGVGCVCRARERKVLADKVALARRAQRHSGRYVAHLRTVC